MNGVPNSVKAASDLDTLLAASRSNWSVIRTTKSNRLKGFLAVPFYHDIVIIEVVQVIWLEQTGNIFTVAASTNDKVAAAIFRSVKTIDATMVLSL